jgi:hypothetical protein
MMDEARILADVLFQTNPFRVKHYRKVWGKDDPPVLNPSADSLEYLRHLMEMMRINPQYPYYVIDHEPEHMPLPEQLELAAQKLSNLKLFQFLTRPVLREGEVSQSVIPISIACIVRDRKTGKDIIPDQELVDRVRVRLAKRAGIPAETIRTEQVNRLRPDSIHASRLGAPPSLRGDGTGRQPGNLPDDQTNTRHYAKEIPSLPIPDERERLFLAFITEHPDTPVTEIYKALGIGVSTGTKIRERLIQQGLLVELELRTGKTGAGRPMKCILPTVAALEFLEKDPPPGRGGVIHRYIQQMVQHGATAKGFTATCEKVIDNGAILDVHLQKGQETIAVEIAVVSTPEREIAHIKNCLQFGYNQVFGVFADETLLARTATAIQASFSPEEQKKVRLLPLSKLGDFG